MGFNVKIFAAPFMNRVHLVTIVLAGMLFAAFRLSGGEVGMKSRSSNGDRSLSTSSVEHTNTVRRPAGIDEGGSDLDALIAKSPRIEYGSGGGSGAQRAAGDSSNRAPAAVRAPSRLSENSPDLDDLVDGGAPPPPRPAPARSRDAGGLNDIEKQLGLR